ncbi:hypothetical protein OGM63_22890 [Plectonema radiosum NIES-515]|uniref:Uncharacterized protein n=1 Tax=Plectonema radiosum NIES-515 TaxID=2986073 RepID=A0ABT3B508_9CYAN|nr:hypothetical protein [Plectonema radiosum]MCV3216325.1 hypothetical protein [Plectonema radiosum NIES-515]
MSISLWIMRVSPKIISINDINEEDILEIGTKSEIVCIISELCPEYSFDESCYYLPGYTEDNTSHFRWRVCLGNDDSVKMIHISPHIGKCDLTIIKNICQRLKCRVFDPQYSEFILTE